MNTEKRDKYGVKTRLRPDRIWIRQGKGRILTTLSGAALWVRQAKGKDRGNSNQDKIWTSHKRK